MMNISRSSAIFIDSFLTETENVLPVRGRKERRKETQTSQSLLFNAISGCKYYGAGRDCQGRPLLMVSVQL